MAPNPPFGSCAIYRYSSMYAVIVLQQEGVLRDCISLMNVKWLIKGISIKDMSFLAKK